MLVAVHSRYPEIAEAIKGRIEAGEWDPGTRLPKLNDLAKEYSANRDTIGRAIAALEAEGYVWAVQGRGIAVRYGTIRPPRRRGDEVKRNKSALGYSFPSATEHEEWQRHGDAISGPTRLDDSRIAGLLGVKPGTGVWRRFRVTGPQGEAPFQAATSWIHPRVTHLVKDVDVNPAAGEWLYRIEKAGHFPIAWTEFHRARMPTKEEAAWLEIPVSLPVLEIVRVGRSGGDGEPVEVTEYVLASDRVETMHKLARVGDANDPWPDEEAGDP
jgi:GntR family transcriptional regulator